MPLIVTAITKQQQQQQQYKNIATAIKSWPATVLPREGGGRFFDFRVAPEVLLTECDRRTDRCCQRLTG